MPPNARDSRNVHDRPSTADTMSLSISDSESECERRSYVAVHRIAHPKSKLRLYRNRSSNGNGRTDCCKVFHDYNISKADPFLASYHTLLPTLVNDHDTTRNGTCIGVPMTMSMPVHHLIIPSRELDDISVDATSVSSSSSSTLGPTLSDEDHPMRNADCGIFFTWALRLMERLGLSSSHEANIIVPY